MNEEAYAHPGELTEVLGPEETCALPLDEHTLPAGSRVGEYVIEKVIGRGGCGVVYAAHHEAARTRVAVKVLRAEMSAFPVMVARFSREVAALEQLAHPNIVALHGVGEVSPGRPYYVMELLEGTDLRTLLARSGRFSPAEALELCRPICEAVEAAHRAGIIHRDLKAQNVLVVEANGERQVKLLDFGIAKLLRGESTGEGLTEPGAVIGSAHNMAPEQVRCDGVDERTDVYALGVMLFQLLTGQYPFEADDSHRVALMHLTAPAPRPSLLAAGSPALDAVVLRCMEKQPERRFASASELLSALRVAAGEATPAPCVRARALAVHVALCTSDEDELDDAALEAFMALIDESEQPLVAAGFSFPLRTASALLAVRLLDGEEREARELAALLRELCERARAQAEGSSGFELTAAWREGEVECRLGNAGLELVGGTLLDVSSWSERPGMAAT